MVPSSFFRWSVLLAVIILAPFSGHAQEKASGRLNLLTNGSFANGLDGWSVQAWNKSGTAAVDAAELRDGRPTLRITSTKGDDTYVTQKITVKPNTRYRLTGYVKTKDVAPDDRKSDAGASLSFGGTFEHTKYIQKTKPWAKVELDFESGGRTEVTIGPRLGHNSALVSGTAWFADLELEEMGRSRK